MSLFAKKSGILFFIMAFIFMFCTNTKAEAGISAPLTVQAYPGVKIFNGGQELTDTNQPYIINNVTYIPLRMLMNSFDKNVYWDSINYRVIVTAGSAEANKDAQIKELQSTIATLNARIASMEAQAKYSSDISLREIKEALEDEFEDDAGDDYFDDDDIEVASIKVSGDEDDISFTIKLDFSNSRNYSNLKKLNKRDIRDFLDDVREIIEDEIDGTDYEDADITGKLVDYDYSKYYVEQDKKGNYEYSWDSDEVSESDLEDVLEDEFADDVGDRYFDDGDIDWKSVSVDIDEDDEEIYYVIKLDFSYADDYDNLEELNKSDVANFLDDVRDTIEEEIEDTDCEDYIITGKLVDNDNSSYYVTDNKGRYTYTW